MAENESEWPAQYPGDNWQAAPAGSAPADDGPPTAAQVQPTTPYVPQPGDIMLATDDKIFWKLTHNLGGTGHPHHSGVVFERPDGTLGVLEAGPHDTTHIYDMDWHPHFCLYAQKGRIWIRQRKVPLTPEQSGALEEMLRELIASAEEAAEARAQAQAATAA